MKNHATKALSVLLVIAMLLSMLAISTSAASLNLAELAANEDANLGGYYDVQDIISITDPEHHTLKIDVADKTVEALQQDIDSGNITLSLDRDATRPYIDSTLYPKQIAGGDMTNAAIWKNQSNKPLFTNFVLTAGEENGATVLTVDFDSDCYFFSRNAMDPSAPHSSGGAYLEICGWFKLTASAGEAVLGTTDLKVAPYDGFHTMSEVYTEIEDIAALANKNGLYAITDSLGTSSAGRNMPYMIIADSEAAVSNWLAFTEASEAQPTKVLADLEAGVYNDIRVPVLYSNIHANEVAATDGIMMFARLLAETGIDGSISYNMLTDFTEAGKAQLEAEMNNPRRCYGGTGTGIAVPDLVKDTATYLGYLQDGNGKSGVVDLDKFYEQETETVTMRDLLGGVFFILVPEENVDGRTYITRTAANGYDLNRDNSFQTTPETANMQKMIGTYNPVSFTEFHGRVTSFQCEPCDPPHEPNFEYDLLAEHLVTGGEAFGIAAVANNDGYNSYVIPQRDYLSYTDAEKTQTRWFDPWDDMSTSYTPQFAMLHGTVAYTVELPAYSQDTSIAVCYGAVGQSNYIKNEKLGYLKAQVKTFERGATNFNSDAFELVGQWFCDQYDNEGAEMDIFRPEYTGEDENGNFYPECYLIPLDGTTQNNVQAARDMMVWLTRNDAKVNVTTAPVTYDGVLYPAGTMVVSMYQAKRSVANSALYDGTLIQGWPGLYSEGITSFNETRGFEMATVTKPAEYAKIAKVMSAPMDYEAACAYAATINSYFSGAKNQDVIIVNNSEDATAAVNALLQAEKQVGLITEGSYKGDFICSYADYLTICGDYAVIATGIAAQDAGIAATLIKTNPTVYITGVPNPSASGCIATSQVGNASWNYDRVAMQNMNFKVTENVEEADVVAGASSLSGDALKAVQAGLPYIGYGSTACRGTIVSTIGGVTRTGLSGSMDCLAYVTYPNETMVNTTNIKYNDDMMYGYGFGFFSAIPENAVALVACDGSREPTEGFIPAISSSAKTTFEQFLNGGILGFSYDSDTLHVALFANTLTNKGHQKDEYSYISNFIFSSLLTDEAYEGSAKAAVAPYNFIDVKDNDWFKPYVDYVWNEGLMHGFSDSVFSPNTELTRGMVATILYRLAGSPTVLVEAPFTDLDSDEFYVDAVNWAYQYGIVNGVTTEKFAPNASVTREQLAAILYRYCQVKGMDTFFDADFALDFADAGSVSTYAKDAMTWMVYNGYINGVLYGDRVALEPTQTATRAQVAAILSRLFAPVEE